MTIETSPYFDLEEPTNQHHYLYTFYDLRNKNIIEELPVSGVSYNTTLSAPGEFAGSIILNPETSVFNVRTATSPGKTGVLVTRDGEYVWDGFIWKRQFDSSSRTLSLTGKGFESYFAHRYQWTTKYWSNEDQLEIARWLVNSNTSAQEIGLIVSNATSPRRRERTMFGYEAKTTGSELEALSGLIDGFDWNVITYDDESGNIIRKLEFYYPERGQTKEETTLRFEFPGAIKSYVLNEDAENSANRITAIGAGEGSEQILVSVENEQQLDAGWPLLEQTRSHKSVLRPSTLKGHADAAMLQLLTPISVYEVTVRADADPALRDYEIGDWATFSITDSYFYDPEQEVRDDGFITYIDNDQVGTVEFMARITGKSVTVNATGVEDVTLTLGGNELASDN